MKRRLMRAYDSMTMPQQCSHRIEEHLAQQLRARESGRWVKAVAPGKPEKRSWPIGAFCLMLALFLGGSLLFVQSRDIRAKFPDFITAANREDSGETPEDFYSLATRKSPKEVEDFAKVVCNNLLTENWAALSAKIRYPVTLGDRQLEESQELWDHLAQLLQDGFLRQTLSQGSHRALYCNWQGICVANGCFWINEVEGQLKVTAFDVPIREEAEEENQKKSVPDLFTQAFAGETVPFAGQGKGVTLSQYCALAWEDAAPKAFTVVDMDGDGICEAVLSLASETGEEKGCAVLRAEEGAIRVYPFRQGELYDLKKDGTFRSIGSGPSQDVYRLVFEEGSARRMGNPEGEEKPSVSWHRLPCSRPDLVLQSYEYVTGTGQSLLPGSPYYYFVNLARQSLLNDWTLIRDYLTGEGKICTEEGGTIYVFDPDAPGSVLYGTLTSENGFPQFSMAGGYICTDEREAWAEIRNLLWETPEYVADLHLGDGGREVATAEALAESFGYAPAPDDRILREQSAVRALTDAFITAYYYGAAETLEGYLSADYSGTPEVSPGKEQIELISFDSVPDRVMEVGETWYIYTSLRLKGRENLTWFNLDLIKEETGWKVYAYNVWDAK